MNKSILLSLTLVVGCGKKGQLPEKPTDPSFKEYVELFESLANRNVGTPINFGELKDGILGTCTKYGNGQKEITISKSHWEYLTPISRKFLIFHELGHCELYKHHDSSQAYSNGCPKSIMYKSLPSHYCLNRYETEYTNEFFD